MTVYEIISHALSEKKSVSRGKINDKFLLNKLIKQQATITGALATKLSSPCMAESLMT